MMGDKNTPIGVKQKKLLSVFIYHPVYFYYYSNENKQTVRYGRALFLLDSSHNNLPIFTARPYDLPGVSNL